MDIKSLIRTIPNFPKEGIMFRDICTLLKDPKGFKHMIDIFSERYASYDFDVIMGIEARGFVIGAALAYTLGKGFIPIRKKGKLPGNTISQTYDLEYGTDTIEIQDDAIDKGTKVLLVDDLLATGGTVAGAISLIEKAGGTVEETCFIVDLPDLKGGEKLKAQGHKIFTLCEFEGE